MAGPQRVGLDEAILDDHRERSATHLQRGCYPGRAECMLYQNQIIYCDVLGYGDKEHKTPMKESTLFRGFSMTKSMTGVGALLLADQGRLRFQDPVSKYIPSFANCKVIRKGFLSDGTVKFDDKEKVQPLRRPITLADLVLHTSGLGYGPQRSAPECRLYKLGAQEMMYKNLAQRCDRGEVTTMEQFCDELAKVPLRHQPGDDYTYSYGVDVMGRVIEVISGQRLDSFLQKEVFKPLGVEDVTFALPRGSARQIAGYYCLARPPAKSGAPRNSRVLERYDGQKPQDSAWVIGSATQKGVIPCGGGFWGTGKGGLLFSLRDVARLVSMFMNDGKTVTGKQLLKPATVRSLQTDWLALPWVAGQKGRTTRKKLKGFDNKDLGWSPIGHVQLTGPHKGAMFMGGTGYWWADPCRKLAAITLYEAYWKVPASGWSAKRDDLEQVAQRLMVDAEKHGKKRSAPNGENGVVNKRARSAA